MDNLTATLHITEQQLVINAAGVLEEQTLGELLEAVQQALVQPALPIVLDLRHVMRMDGRGLSLLLTFGQQMIGAERGLTLRLTVGTQPARVLELSQIDELMFTLCGQQAPYFFAIVMDASEQK